MTLPLMKICPLPLPEATPRSASRASPGPLTMHPITATRMGAVTFLSPSVTAFASWMTSTWARPQLGHEMMSNLRLRSPMYSSSLQPTLTSSTGGADRDTRIVSPMPSASSAPNARHDLMVPCHAGPASVTPRCSGQSPLDASSR